MLFTLSSALCGLAPSLTMLIVFRILQGIGGGALQPISQAILVESFPRHKQGMAMAVYGMGVVVAPVIGPTLGGWITDNYSWRWIFLINIPIGALSLTLTSLLIFDPPYLVRKAWQRLEGGLPGPRPAEPGPGIARNHPGRRTEERLVRIEFHCGHGRDRGDRRWWVW